MSSSYVAELCNAYARHSATARLERRAADDLYLNAPPEALPHLDAIKRVMEIDPDVTDTSLILFRASVVEL